MDLPSQNEVGVYLDGDCSKKTLMLMLFRYLHNYRKIHERGSILYCCCGEFTWSFDRI